MRKQFFPMELLLLFLLFVECIFVLEDQHKAYFWVAISLVAIISYILEGARPYSPVFFGIALADYLELGLLQKMLLFLAVLIVNYIKFYHIPIVGKGPYNSGYRYYKHEDIQLSIFYPSTSDGQHPKWIPSQSYTNVFYDIVYVDPTQMRIPFRIFKFFVSYLVKIKMPVLGDASLYVNDSKDESWNVVIFSHGLGSNMNNFSAICGWWASHGYIVVSIQHSHDQVRIDFDKKLLNQIDILQRLLYKSRNADLAIRTRQTEAVVTEILYNNLLGKVFKEIKSINVEGMYFAGQSFGGTTVLETTANMIIKNTRPAILKGLICLDAWYFPLSNSTYQHLLNQNILLINSQTFFASVPKCYQLEEKMGRLRDVNKDTMKAFFVTKTDHLSTSDFVFALGNILSMNNTVKLQSLSVPIIQLHQIVISLFMEGKKIEQILEISNNYSKQQGLWKKGVRLVEQWRFSRQKCHCC